MVRIAAFDHVRVRVSDPGRALAFYAALGFERDAVCSNERVAEVVAPDGVRLNLIFNGRPPPDGRNVLMDAQDKWPGYTHAAFVAAGLQAVLEWASAAGVPVTEGPVDWGRRTTCFLRDPDGNVLEFNELKPPPTASVLARPANRSSPRRTNP